MLVKALIQIYLKLASTLASLQNHCFCFSQDNNLDVELDFNLLIEDPNSRVFSDVAMWSNKRIIFKTVIDGGKQLEEDEAIFDRPGNHFQIILNLSSYFYCQIDQIMGASHLEGHYIFLSSLNGIIRCTTSSTSLLPASVEESVLHTSLLTVYILIIHLKLLQMSFYSHLIKVFKLLVV